MPTAAADRQALYVSTCLAAVRPSPAQSSGSNVARQVVQGGRQALRQGALDTWRVKGAELWTDMHASVLSVLYCVLSCS